MFYEVWYKNTSSPITRQIYKKYVNLPPLSHSGYFPPHRGDAGVRITPLVPVTWSSRLPRCHVARMHHWNTQDARRCAQLFRWLPASYQWLKFITVREWNTEKLLLWHFLHAAFLFILRGIVCFREEERNAVIPEHRNTSKRVSVPQDTRHSQPLFVSFSNSTTVVVMPLLHLADER